MFLSLRYVVLKVFCIFLLSFCFSSFIKMVEQRLRIFSGVFFIIRIQRLSLGLGFLWIEIWYLLVELNGILVIFLCFFLIFLTFFSDNLMYFIKVDFDVFFEQFLFKYIKLINNCLMVYLRMCNCKNNIYKIIYRYCILFCIRITIYV